MTLQHDWRAAYTVWRRCSSFTGAQYVRASRLAILSLRSGHRYRSAETRHSCLAREVRYVTRGRHIPQATLLEWSFVLRAHRPAALQRQRLDHAVHPAGAVHEPVEVDADVIEQRQVQVRQRRQLVQSGCAVRPWCHRHRRARRRSAGCDDRGRRDCPCRCPAGTSCDRAASRRRPGCRCSCSSK